MGTVVFKYDVSKHLESKHSSRIFKKIDVATVSLEIDSKVMDALEASKDRDLAAIKIVEKAQKVCEATTSDLAKKLTEMEEKYEAMKASGKDESERGKLVKAYRAEVVKELEELKGKLKVLPEEQWKKFLAKYAEGKKEYRSYKVNAVVDVAVGTLGVAASAAAIGGTAHTGGASLVLGVIGMVRSVAKISEVLYSIAVDVEKQGTALAHDLKSLKADFETGLSAKGVGKDLAKTAVNAIFGAPFFATVATVEKKAETLGGKVAGTYVGGVKLSREVTASLNAQKKLAGDIAKLKIEGAKDKAKKKVEGKIGDLENRFTKLFEKAADMNAKAERAEVQLKAVRKALEELGDKTKSLAYFEKALTVLTAVGLGAAAAGVGIAHAAGEVLEIAKEAVSLTSELVVQAKEAFE